MNILPAKEVERLCGITHSTVSKKLAGTYRGEVLETIIKTKPGEGVVVTIPKFKQELRKSSASSWVVSASVSHGIRVRSTKLNKTQLLVINVGKHEKKASRKRMGRGQKTIEVGTF